MSQIQQTVWAYGYLAPGQSLTWWGEPVSKEKMRWYVAIPGYYVPPGQVGTDPVDNDDQFVDIPEVYYILKGYLHATDGTGGAGDLQVNVTVRNRSAQYYAWYQIYQIEVV